MNKKTVLIGASDNPERYAFKAATSLHNHGHEVILLGKRSGTVIGQAIIKERPVLTDIDTVTLYINTENQREWYNYIVSLKPKRVVFNPGTENSEFKKILEQNNIEALEACTLVMLSIGNY